MCIEEYHLTLPFHPLKARVENLSLYKTLEGYKKTRLWQAEEGMAGTPKGHICLTF